MKKSNPLLKLTLATTCCSLLLSGAARASLIWDGNASNGLGVFKVLNLEDKDGNSEPNPSPNGSSVTIVTDGSEGQVFKFDKAVNDRRCEAHGAKNFNPAIGSNILHRLAFQTQQPRG